MADLRQAFGIVLKKARNSIPMTQEELALKSGCYASDISEFENGKISPTINKAHDIIWALGFTLSDFFNDVEQEYRRQQSTTSSDEVTRGG